MSPWFSTPERCVFSHLFKLTSLLIIIRPVIQKYKFLNGKSNNFAREEIGSLSKLHTFSVNYSISITM